MTSIRPVFYVSDGTGITAETIGHSLLTQFSGMQFLTDRLSFVDDPDKAREARDRIHAAGVKHGVRPIVVNSCVDVQLSMILAESGALMLDVFAPSSSRSNASSSSRGRRAWARRTAWSTSRPTIAASTR